MVLDDRHIAFLEQVRDEAVFFHLSQYWGPTGLCFDQMAATMMSRIGAIHYIIDEFRMVRVALTPLGENFLLEEYEAWA